MTLHEQQIDRLFAAVKAAFSVEKKTFTDLIHKKTTSILRGKRQDWIRVCLLTDEKIKANAKEDEETVTKREIISDKIMAMKRCDELISSMT